MNSKTKGILLMLTAALFFSLMATIVKFASDYSIFQKIFFRNFIGLIAMLFLIKKTKTSIFPNNKKLIFLRSIFGLMGVFFYYLTINNLNLANAVMLNKTSPFFVIIFSAFFLKEKITSKKIISLIIAIIGIIFIIKPTANFEITYSITGLLSAIFAGAAYTIIRKLSESDSPITIVFYFCLISTIAVTPKMILSGGFLLDSKAILLLSLIGVCATIAQNLMTYGYKFAPASELSIYSYSEIIFSIFIGIIIWSEIPDFYSIIGIVAIFLAGLINYKK